MDTSNEDTVFGFAPTAEFVTAHLGFLVTRFTSELVSSAENAFANGIVDMDTFVNDKYAEFAAKSEVEEPPELECERGMSQFESQLLDAADKRFDQLELYCYDVAFNVPEGVELRGNWEEVSVENDGERMKRIRDHF